jgi:3-deoxy-D-manno-octulosonic-acid transferase
MILCGDTVSVDRFIALGAAEETTRFVGNSKYDSPVTPFSDEQLEAFRAEFWINRCPTIVLGSVRPGEEEGWLRAVQRRLADGVDVQLVVVPRHKEKLQYFQERLSALGLPWRLRSTVTTDKTEPVVLVDTFGELERIYALADLAFIGATLVPIGGHNPLEASARGVAVAVGPHHQNYRDIVAELLDAGALILVSSDSDIDRLVDRVVVEGDSIRECGKAGKQIWMNHQGATRRILQEIAGVVNGWR